jgi:hypothetical protein
MAQILITLEQIKAACPCIGGWKKILAARGGVKADHSEPFPLSEALDSNGLGDTLWALRCIPEHDALWRRYVVWCARQVRHLMADPRSLDALDVADRYSQGLATDAELAAARAAAEAAEAAAWDAGAAAGVAAEAAAWAAWDAGAAAWAAGAAAWAAAEAAEAAAWDAAWAAAEAAEAAAWDAAEAAEAAWAAKAAAWDAAEAAEAAWAAKAAARAAQSRKLRQILDSGTWEDLL